MKNRIFLFLLIASITLFSCSKVIFKEIDCNAFNLAEEYYWPPINNGDSIVFVDSSNVRNKFIVVEKIISHRTKYTSDTGCGCYDESKMLMTNNSDSIWFRNELRYTEGQTVSPNEDVVLSLNNVHSLFYETHTSTIPSFTIDSLTFTNVKKFEYNYTENLKVKTVYLVKNLGIIRFELVNGEIWVNEKLTDYATTTIDSFSYSESICD